MMAISWVCVTSTTRWIRQFAISTRVVMQGRNIGDLLSEAMLAYLARVSVSRGRSTLRALAPEPFPDGNEGLSREIDANRLWRPAVVIVLDSSFLIGFYNERDAHHAAASTLMDRFLAGTWGKGRLLEYIFLEITAVLMLRRDLSVATRVGRILLDAEELEFVPCSDLFSQTIETFSNQIGRAHV